jgi:dienelactone hydrolase
MKTSAAICRLACLGLIALACLVAALPAQTPPPPAKRLPPAGIAIPENDRAELTASVAAFRTELDALRSHVTAQNKTLLPFLADVEIFHKAVDWALRYDEFFAPREIAFARRMLVEGRERATQLHAGKTPWLEATGLIVRGYRSKIDDSLQPFGLVVPPTWKNGPNRLEVWLLGRGEKRTELAFLAERQAGPPQLTPPNSIVLVPYGRFCNATKFAGEVDVFEAMETVRKTYSIDPQRIAVAGFSMGGASTWHLAAHHAGLWCSASPGAGFAETAIYNKLLAPGKEPPTWWEQKLWGWYDATRYAANLSDCPTIAYSGEIDPQKQSADLMEAAMAAEGLKLQRLIGPKTAHQYHAETKKELLERLNALADRGRSPLTPHLHVTTYTLRYPGDSWVQIAGLEKHWERADVDARIEGKTVVVKTKNVTALRLRCFGNGSTSPDRATVDDEVVTSPKAAAIDAGRAVLTKDSGKWKWIDGLTNDPQHLRKLPGITGPIDDAFMDRFVFVTPTGKPLNEAVGRWANAELSLAKKMWRDIFRGDAPVKDDTAINDTDLAAANLILWGDPSSNGVLARIVAKLPLQWDAQKLIFRGKTYDAANHALILIFPNPLNPQHYVVVNSGIDFREHAYGTNSLQIPKLPDFAVIDLREPPGARWPGKIVDAGFFDESWK